MSDQDQPVAQDADELVTVPRELPQSFGMAAHMWARQRDPVDLTDQALTADESTVSLIPVPVQRGAESGSQVRT